MSTPEPAARPAPPPRPAWSEERPAAWLFRALGPRLRRVPQAVPPAGLQPFEELQLLRQGRPGWLAATSYPASGTPRGSVLFLHPWMEWGQAYFHRRGRLEAVRSAGYHALTLELPGLRSSAPPVGFPDLDVEAGLLALVGRCPGLPLFVWGVSAGGYWAHPLLARRGGDAGAPVRAAFFEDVSPHLLEWSWRVAPLWRPAFAFYRRAFPRAYAFLDARRHAAALRLDGCAYVSGELDAGVRPADTALLARLAGGTARVVPQAGHLGAIKRDPDGVIELALATFERALPSAR